MVDRVRPRFQRHVGCRFDPLTLQRLLAISLVLMPRPRTTTLEAALPSTQRTAANCSSLQIAGRWIYAHRNGPSRAGGPLRAP